MASPVSKPSKSTEPRQDRGDEIKEGGSENGVSPAKSDARERDARSIVGHPLLCAQVPSKHLRMIINVDSRETSYVLRDA